VVPQLAAHDALGTSVFRVEIQGAGSLGFATDLGRITDATVEHLAGVDVLAIESNYCPELQRRSGRPAFLQQRITGGSGHLSNHEAADAIARIAPTRAVVMLHLSRQCNRPSLVSELHASAMQEVWIASATDPTRWIEVRRADPAPRAPVETALVLDLYDTAFDIRGRTPRLAVEQVAIRRLQAERKSIGHGLPTHFHFLCR